MSQRADEGREPFIVAPAGGLGTVGPRYQALLQRLAELRSAGVLLGLDRTRAVLERLGNPQRRAVTVHIAGTNGKGSTAAMADCILRAAGIRTGLYTSPHLCRFSERFRVDGQEADGERLGELGAAILDVVAATGIPLTYFEVATVLGFSLFADAGVEAAVIETGLGGRLDATTTADPVATAITSIGLDHVEILGPTLVDIAREKAGIAKPGVPLYLAPVAAEADAEVAAAVARAGGRLQRFGIDFAPAPVAPRLGGGHQATNAAVAVALARDAARQVAAARGSASGGPALDETAVIRGLREVRWPGRLEWLDERILVDCAHNLEGAQWLRREIDRLPHARRALVFSVVAGKAAGEMLAVLAPAFQLVVVTRSSSERSLAPEALAAVAGEETRPRVVVAASAADALQVARAHLAGDEDRSEGGAVIVGAGSTFLVGDLRALVLGERRDPLPTSDPLPHR